MNSSDQRALWPRPAYDEEQQPHFLFLVTPPFSGSTAIAELLNSSVHTTLLQERGEGQWLLPGLCANERWDSAMPVDFEAVKAVWLSTFQQIHAANPQVNVVIEKSPPNMVRIEQLVSQFRDVSLLANNRDPYANCASILYRNHQPETLSAMQRTAVLQTLAADWLKRSEKIRELVCRLDIPLLGYEEFCESPAVILNKLALPSGVAESIDIRASIKVKDYPLQAVVNQNERQLALLDQADVEAISAVLAPHAELLDFFSYEPR